MQGRRAPVAAAITTFGTSLCEQHEIVHTICYSVPYYYCKSLVIPSRSTHKSQSHWTSNGRTTVTILSCGNQITIAAHSSIPTLP